MNIFEKRSAQEQIEQDVRDARTESIRSKREDRELRKAQSTGRVSSFLKNRSESNDTLREVLGVIENKDPTESVQAIVQYQKPVGEIKSGTQQLFSGGAGNQTSIETILPPRPNDNNLYVLGVRNTELQWIQTEDCG